jgi:hypothetical protein
MIHTNPDVEQRVKEIAIAAATPIVESFDQWQVPDGEECSLDALEGAVATVLIALFVRLHQKGDRYESYEDVEDHVVELCSILFRNVAEMAPETICDTVGIAYEGDRGAIEEDAAAE